MKFSNTACLCRQTTTATTSQLMLEWRISIVWLLKQNSEGFPMNTIVHMHHYPFVYGNIAYRAAKAYAT